MTARTHPDQDFAPVPDPILDAEQPTAYCTGLTALDTITGGGIRPGDLWVITGRPGQGRSMLVTQLAGHLALQHQVPTYLVSDRDSATVVAARLHALRARVPLNHITERRLTDRDLQRIAKTSHELQAAPLRVLAGSHARHRALNQIDALIREEPIAAVFDDPDWQTPWDLGEARRLADRGTTVIVALRQDRLVRRGDDDAGVLDPDAALADFVVDVRHNHIDADGELVSAPEPGYARLSILRNRRGPWYAVTVRFHAHYACYFDSEQH